MKLQLYNEENKEKDLIAELILTLGIEDQGYEFVRNHTDFYSGTILVPKNGKLELLGDDISGKWTQGCGCCSCIRTYRNMSEEYLGYYLLPGIPHPEEN